MIDQMKIQMMLTGKHTLYDIELGIWSAILETKDSFSSRVLLQQVQ